MEDEQLPQASIFGVEKKPLPHLLCTTNMILHGSTCRPTSADNNALARPLRDFMAPKTASTSSSPTRPSAAWKDGIEATSPASFGPAETADLFLVLIMHLLKDGSRAAVVLPTHPVRRGHQDASGTVARPATCHHRPPAQRRLQPYTGIGTNLLFFTKGRADAERLVLRAPPTGGLQELLEDQADAYPRFAAERKPGGIGVIQTGSRTNAVESQRRQHQTRNYNLDIRTTSPDAMVHDRTNCSPTMPPCR